MSFSKISLYSAIFFSSISLSNQITAMEEVTESIKQELSILDQNIITLQKALQPAQEQMNQDKEKLDHCKQQRENTKTPGTFIKDSQYTMNCDNLNRAYGYIYNANEYEYHGRKEDSTIYLSKSFPRHRTLITLLVDRGSLGRYNGIQLSIKKDKYDYNQFQDDLARGMRVNDLEYLQLLKQKIQINNKEIQERNTCLSNQLKKR